MRSQVWSGAVLAPPDWAVDFGGREHIFPQPARIIASAFLRPDAVVVTVDAAGAAANAVSVPVLALSGAIPSGTILDFNGDKKFARLTADAAAGATSLTTEALPTALSAADVATYAGVRELSIPSGTAIGRTYAERDANTDYGPADASDDEVWLIYNDVKDALDNPEVELYRHGSGVREDYLPGWTALVSGVKTKIRANYECINSAGI